MAGRLKMTEQQKVEAKAKREAEKAGDAKATVAAAATVAAKPDKKPVIFNSEIDLEEKALFLNHHLPAVRRLRALLNTANSNLRTAYKKAKAEAGFTKADFDTAFAVETAENEARERGKIARQLKIAKIMGSSLGAQLDMFLEPDRTPAVDRAWEEGQSDAMKNIAARPKYDPSTAQHASYLEGFHSVSADLIKKGIGKLDPEASAMAEKDAKARAKADQQKAVDAKSFDKPEAKSDKPAAETVNPPAPASGVAMTRAQFKAQQEAMKAAESAGGKKATAH